MYFELNTNKNIHNCNRNHDSLRRFKMISVNLMLSGFSEDIFFLYGLLRILKRRGSPVEIK